MSQKRFAVIISRLFDPTWLIPLMLASAVTYSLLNGLRWRFILLLVLIDGFIPFLYFVHLLRTKEISDWDTTNRRERYRLYGFTVAVHAVGVLLAFLLGKITLAKILLAFWLLAAAYAAVTLVWKISLHTGVSAAAVSFLIILFGRRWLWLYAIVAVIGWARVVMSKHTLSQVIVGAILAPVILIGALWSFGITRNQARAPSEVTPPRWTDGLLGRWGEAGYRPVPDEAGQP